METPHSIDPLPAQERILASRPAGGAIASRASEPTGPAFQALLEDLERRARDVHLDSSSIHEPADLAGAVDRARASLADALELGGQILEAYRQAVRQSPGA